MTTIHGFELVHEQAIPELNSTARLYRHVKTGAELLSLLNAMVRDGITWDQLEVVKRLVQVTHQQTPVPEASMR